MENIKKIVLFVVGLHLLPINIEINLIYNVPNVDFKMILLIKFV
jgi:hypothetical protein